MKRIVLAVTAVALVAAAMAAWGGAVPLASSGADAPSQAKPKPKLPPLPANIKQRGRWNIGVKCDVPPFGYINVKGQNAGFDVEIAQLVLSLRVRQGQPRQLTSAHRRRRVSRS